MQCKITLKIPGKFSTHYFCSKVTTKSNFTAHASLLEQSVFTAITLKNDVIVFFILYIIIRRNSDLRVTKINIQKNTYILNAL